MEIPYNTEQKILNFINVTYLLSVFGCIYLVSMSKIFHEKWDRVYRLAKQKLSFPVDESTRFGPIQAFDKKKVSIYHVIRNISYAEKKGSTWVNKTRQDKNIQMPFNANKFHFALMPYFEIVAFVDLDRGELIYPDQRDTEQQLQEEEYKAEHIIKISKSHIAQGHSIFVPFLRKNLPQVLTPLLIESVIKLSGILPAQKIGYNSQGGGSTVNHFHAQIINGESLLNQNLFHFQTIKGSHVTTLLVSSSNGQQAKLEVTSFQYISALYIRIASRDHKLHDSGIIRHVTKAVWQIVQFALDHCIPHNLNIPNGHQIYIILRGFATHEIRYGWVEFSGVQILTSHEDFETITAEEIERRYARLGLPREVIEGRLIR